MSSSRYYREGRFMTNWRDGRGRGRGYSPGYSITTEDDDDMFRVRRAHEYLGPSPVMETPQVLGTYSVDEDRSFGHDNSKLKFLGMEYLPQDGEISVRMDLNRAWDMNEHYRGNSEETFNNLLRWILSNQDQLLDLEASDPRLDVDFVGVRRCFSTLMRAPYNTQETWKLRAKAFRGSIYIMHEKCEEKLPDPETLAIMEKASVWGHKFEQYMTGGDPDEGHCANDEFRCVLRNKLGNFSLMYAPEVDGADPELYEENFKDLSAFVTVKCCKEIIPEGRPLENFRKFKLNLWWTENKLSGIPRIVVGYRNDDGIVHTLESLNTDDIPELAKDLWQPEVSLNFLSTFLGYIKRKVEEQPTAIHEFKKERRDYRIRHSTLLDISTSTAGAEGLTGLHFSILPPWYMEQMFTTPETDEVQD